MLSMPRRWPVLDILLLIVLSMMALLLAHLAYASVRHAVPPVDAPPVFLPLEDFHVVEQAADGAGSFRWTDASSTALLPNPGGRATLHLTLAAGAGRTVPVDVTVGNTPPVSFLVGPAWRTYTLLQPMPASERVALTIAAPTMQDDGRALGVMVRQVSIFGGGSPPALVLLALVCATLGGYLLLRQSGLSPLYAAGCIVAAHVLVLLWQVYAGGWRYALFVPLLLLIALASVGAVVVERWLLPRVALSATPARPAVVGWSASWPLGVVLLLALLVRLPWLNAPDPVGDLELAARRMGHLFGRGLDGAYIFDGDYMPLRLYLLFFLGQFVPLFDGSFHEPLPFVTRLLVKLPGLLADMVVIGIIYTWSLRWLTPRGAALVAALYALAPPVWINVAWWGQVDALLMLPLLASVVLLERAGGRWSWLCWTVALLIKPQAIVLAPLLYIATLRLHGGRGIAQGGALVVGGFGLAALPLALAGQGPGLMQAYLGSVGRFPQLTAGAYNLWYLITLGAGGHDTGQGIGGLSYRLIGLLLVGTAALLVGLALLRRADGPLRAQGAAVLALAFFVLPTQIHERYLFLPLAFLALCIASNARMVVPFLILTISATLNIFGTLDGFVPLATAWIASSPIPFVLAVTNLAVLVVLVVDLLVSSYQPLAADRQISAVEQPPPALHQPSADG